MGVNVLPVLVHSDEGLIALQCRRFRHETLRVFQHLLWRNGFPWRERIENACTDGRSFYGTALWSASCHRKHFVGRNQRRLLNALPSSLAVLRN